MGTSQQGLPSITGRSAVRTPRAPGPVLAEETGGDSGPGLCRALRPEGPLRTCQ